jgi:hypothetical protein
MKRAFYFGLLIIGWGITFLTAIAAIYVLYYCLATYVF